MKIIKKHKKSNSKIIKSDVVVIGTGNIAIKHTKIIKRLLPDKKITLFNYRNKRIANSVMRLYDYVVEDSELIEVNKKNSFVVIASPASLHVEHAINFSDKGFHLFIEKPLSINTNRLKRLFNIIKTRDTCLYIAYNLNFLNGIQQLKKMIKGKEYGEVTHSNIYAYSNFINWRKNKKFKKTVTSNSSLGGGAVSELSHELDYALDIFGKPYQMLSTFSKSNDYNLDIDTKSSIRFLYRKKTVNIYLDILSDIEKRICYIYFDDLEAQLDINKNSIILLKNGKIIKKYSYNQTVEDTYFDQMKYFISYMSKKNNDNNLSDITYLPKIINRLRYNA